MKANGWPIKTLGDALVRTETINPQERPNAEFEYVDVSSVSNESFKVTDTQRLKGKDAPSRARRLIRTNDVLFATIRPTLRRIAVVPERLDGQVCSTGYFVMRPKPDLDSRFLFYSLFTDTFMDQMEALQTGASYPAVNDSQVRAQMVPVPPLPEQRRIVGILDEAFAGIATAKANAEKNLRNARALFESVLGNTFAGRGSDWQDIPFGELVSTNEVGIVRNSLEQSDLRQYPYVRMNHITRDNRFELFDFTRIDATEAEVRRYQLQEGDFLFNTRNSVELVGKACVYPGGDEPVLYNNNIMRVRFLTQVDPRFVLLAFSSKRVRDNLEQLKSGTTNVAAIYYKDLRHLSIPLAPCEPTTETCGLTYNLTQPNPASRLPLPAKAHRPRRVEEVAVAPGVQRAVGRGRAELRLRDFRFAN